MTQTQLEPEHFAGSHAAFRQLLQEYTLKSRLNTVKMTEALQIAKFKIALSLAQETAKNLEKTAEEISMPLPFSFPFQSAPLGAKFIEKAFESYKSKEMIKNVRHVLRPGTKDHFFDSNMDAVSFEKQLKEYALSKEEQINASLKEVYEKAKQNESLTKHINFYTKWGAFLKAEMKQGFLDKNEALGGGVCLAICFRLLEEFQLNPDQEITERLTINAIDRLRQAFYEIAPKIYKKLLKEGKDAPALYDEDFIKKMQFVPREWLDKSQFQESRSLFEGIYDPEEADFNKCLMSPKIMEKLKQSHGWVFTSLIMADGAHQILIRLDQNCQKAWLFDPNIGFFCFEADGKTFDQARIECLQCFRSICETLYRDLVHILAGQLIPMT